MPHWVIVLALAIVGWLLLSIVGGLVVGRLIALASRGLSHVSRPRLRVVHGAARSEEKKRSEAA